MCKVLHITDLHIHDPDAANELLRRGKRREYLGSLARLILKESGRPDAVFCTGDVVNYGRVQFFDYAEEILQEFASALGIEPARFVFAPGNHDILKELEEKRQSAEARAPFFGFAAKFVGTSDRTSNDLGALYKISEDLYLLALDSLLGAEGPNLPAPGKLEPGKDTDEIMRLVQSVPVEATLIVGSHYGVDPIAGRTYAWEDEQTDWFQRHIWTSATPVARRIEIFRHQGKTVWLCGDIHQPTAAYSDGVYYLTTGRIGLSTGKHDAGSPREARLLTVGDDGTVVVHKYFYPMSGRSQAEYGRWQFAVESLGAEVFQDPGEIVQVPIVQEPGGDGEASASLPLVVTETFSSSIAHTEVIDAAQEDAFLNLLRNGAFFRWGRFQTSSDEVLLSWVSVNSVMNVTFQLSSVVAAIAEWIRTRIYNTDSLEYVAFVGIDCWGSVLASQVSVLTGSKNFCIGSRGRGLLHTPEEGFAPSAFDDYLHCKVFVLFTDAVATGRTLSWVWSEVLRRVPSARCAVVSLFADPKQPLAVDAGFIEKCATICRIERPYLPVDRVPGGDILPASIYFDP